MMTTFPSHCGIIVIANIGYKMISTTHIISLILKETTGNEVKSCNAHSPAISIFSNKSTYLFNVRNNRIFQIINIAIITRTRNTALKELISAPSPCIISIS